MLSSQPPLKRPSTSRRSRQGPNIVVLHQRLLAHHRTVLNRWLAAGRCMGLCDASVCSSGPAGRPGTDYVMVWVRENPDPAYMVAPEGMRWRVTDCIRGATLASHPSFEAALHAIRPVLKLHEAA